MLGLVLAVWMGERMSLRPSPAFLRLLAFVAMLELLTSRATLLVHEFVGHGATAILMGGRVVGWHLFLFAGGRVTHRSAHLGMGARLVIALGGVALELVFGALAAVVATRVKSTV